MVWLIEHFPTILMVIGVVLLIVEVAIFGFATFILFFVGLAVGITGLLMQFGVLDITLNRALWSSAILSVSFTVLLWKPLRALQNKSETERLTSDFAQLTFRLPGDVDSATEDVFYPYSGIQWKVKSSTPLKQGQLVKVIQTDVSVFWVEALDDDAKRATSTEN